MRLLRNKMLLSRDALRLSACLVIWLIFLRLVDAVPESWVPALTVIGAAVAVTSLVAVKGSVVPIGWKVSVVAALAVGVVALHYILPVVTTVDARDYYRIVTHNTLHDLVKSGVSGVGGLGLFGVELLRNLSAPTRYYPAFLQVWLGRIIYVSSTLVAISNIAIWSLASLAWVNAVYKHRFNNSIQARNICIGLFALLMLSPSAVYWNAVMAKDVSTVALIMAAAVTLADRRYILGVSFMLFSLMLRPYAPFLAVAFCLYLVGDTKKLAVISAFGLFVAYVFTGTPTVFVNTLYTGAMLVVSPLPWDPTNWVVWRPSELWDISPLYFTVESTIVSVIFLIGLYVFLSRKGRALGGRDFLRLGLVLTVEAIILALVGFIVHTANGDGYRIGSLTTNIIRKKFTVWPIVATWLAFTAYALRSKTAKPWRAT